MAQPNVFQEISNRWWRRHLMDQRLFDGNLNTILKDAAREAGKLVDDAVGDSSIGILIRRTQYAESRTAILQSQGDMWGQVKARTDSGVRQASERAESLWESVNDRLASVIDVPATRSQFKNAAEHAIGNLRSRYINSIDLAPSVYKNNALANGLVDRAVNRGILLNKSAAEIARDVRDLIRPDVQGGISYAAKRLGRTELNNAFHETTIRSAVAQPWVQGMGWNLSGSHPRLDICNEYAEQDNYNMGSGVYPSRLVPGKPHPQCLCYVTAITQSDKDFINSLFEGEYDSFLNGEGSI